MNLNEYVYNNPLVLLSDKKLKALLSDVYLNDRLSVNLLMNAYNIGIVNEIREAFPVDQIIVSRLSKRLVSDYGVSDEKAHWAVNAWISVLTQEVIEKLTDAESHARFDENLEKRKREGEILSLAAETQLMQDEEILAREGEQRTQIDSRLLTRDDYSDYYVNPSLNESSDYIYIPCGFGQGDNGFLIYGIKKEKMCRHKDANVFALVYNYLVRSSLISDEDIPSFFREQDNVYEINYQSVFRLGIVILMMIRHNCTKGDSVVFHYTEDKENLKYAVQLINEYAALFSRLIGIDPVKVTVKISKTGIPLTMNKKTNGIYIEENNTIPSNARELWYGRKINYNLTKENLPDLEYILKEISNFNGFKEGQFSALCDMLRCRKHSVCIMPTGSGKSLIFYIASLLQPLPLFVVSPTDILICDQIRNLKNFHHFDNVAHLQLSDNNSFDKWEIRNSINYLTPMTFQNRNLLVKFRYLNAGTRLFDMHEERIASGALVSYIVLDEIHCLSNWGHDFRPEYLMLSKYLNKYFDHITFLGFTATANYTVVEDVQKQLNIPQDNFFSPISFERFNVSYDFRMLHTEEEMLEKVTSITEILINRDERTIVFTKSDEISEKVGEAIGWEADIFLKDDPTAYYHFAAGESKILVASDELGVGINLPNIRNVIHYGLPLSKNEYVQEIGRAGRANEKVKSYVLYLDTTNENVPDGLLKRNTPIQALPVLLDGYCNDYSDVYKKISNGAVSDEELYDRLIQIYNEFVAKGRAMTVDTYPFEIIETAKQYLYMLYITGYINDWYSYSQSKDGQGIDILVDICSTNTGSYKKDPNKMLNRMKERMHDYFIYMGNSRESIARVRKAKSPEEIIRIYVRWYYEKFLYHHNEQFLDFFEFIQTNSECDKDKITEEIKDYFVLPFAKLKSDEVLYNELSIKEIIAKATTGVSKKTLANLERINSSRYSYNIDLALFCGHLRMNNVFDESRLERILSELPNDEIIRLSDALAELYPSCSTSSKIIMLNYMERNSAMFKTTYKSFLNKVYGSGFKDAVYYGIMASTLNRRFSTFRRIDCV